MKLLFYFKAVSVLSVLLFINSYNIFAQQLESFTDTRDGKTYKAIRVGQTLWMAENLWWKPADPNEAYELTIGESKYGYFYHYEVAKTVACPPGWRLPTDHDWNNLITAAGGRNNGGRTLKANYGWDSRGNGSNDLNFSALPAGRRQNAFHPLIGLGEAAYFWTSDQKMVIILGRDNSIDKTRVGRTFKMSVRCVR